MNVQVAVLPEYVAVQSHRYAHRKQEPAGGLQTTTPPAIVGSHRSWEVDHLTSRSRQTF